MAPTLSPSTASSLHAYIDAATKDAKPSLPGAIVHIINTQGETIFSHASPSHSPQTLLAIHSGSKTIGAIAFMQLVDRGLISLDDPTAIDKWLPELASKKVLVGEKKGAYGKKEYVFEDRKGVITPRMLLDHTNGTCYTFFNTELRDYLSENAFVETEGSEYWETLLKSPLFWQPGTKTNYGQGVEWLSVLIERVTGKALEDVLWEGIFEPLGIKHEGFRGEWGGSVVAGDEGVDFWPASVKVGDGSFVSVPGFAEKKVEREDAWPKGKRHVQSVATGLITNMADLARIYSILLPQNAGVDPQTHKRLLSSHSASEFHNTTQHPLPIRHNARAIPTANPLMLAYDLQTPHRDPTGCFGLGTAIQGEDRTLQDGRRGRSKGSLYWFGVGNLAFWIDAVRGVVVVLAGNFFPLMEAGWLEFTEGVEGLVYEGLEG